MSVDNRLRILRDAQNPDGGWGFFARKQSWLEPTAWAMMALARDASSKDACERGWKLVRSWQLPDGSWPANAVAKEPHWTTSLAVTLHSVRGVSDDAMRRGVDWLVDLSGGENDLSFRMAHFINPKLIEMDPSLKAWPWRPGNMSWVEPTAHALVALKSARKSQGSSRVDSRIDQGEKMLLERRCSDGGWNYGNRRVMGHDLPSYPETTALALYGLSGNPKLNISGPVTVARKYFAGTRSPLAKAWLAVALRSHSISVGLPEEPLAPGDLLVTALEGVALTGVLA